MDCSSELLQVSDDVGQVTPALGGGDGAVRVLLQFTGAQAFIQHVQSLLGSAGLLVHSVQLLLELRDSLGLLTGLHGGQLLLLVLAMDVSLLPSTLGASLEQVGAAALLS